MCTGIEIAMIAMAAASTVMTVAGQMQQGETARKTAEYQAAVAENNAIAARQQAEFDERQQREKALRLMATQRARASKGGVLAEQGSPLFINLDMGEKAEIDALNIRRSGEVRATDYRSQAELGRFRGAAEERQSYLRAGSSLLDGMSKVTSMAGTASAKHQAGQVVT